jgi:hypothetical protein
MRPAEEGALTRIHEKDFLDCSPVTHGSAGDHRRKQKCPANESRAPCVLHRHARQGVELEVESDGFFNVSPFAVTAAPDVGDVFFMFFPRVEVPLESVTPDCD